jgi:hypothetical protein
MKNQIQKCIFLFLNSKWELEEKCDKDWDKKWQIRPLSVSISKHEKDILEDMTRILTRELILNSRQKDKESTVQVFFWRKEQ